MDDFRRFFLRGLAALVPTLITFGILLWVYTLINENVGSFITRGLQTLCQWISAEPAPGLVDEEHDPLKYGTPIDEWDALGRRLTIEYKAIHHPALQFSDPDRRRFAVVARNDALWNVTFQKYHMHVFGFLIAIIFVYFTGFLLASFIGRAAWRTAEGVLVRIPIIRAIYTNVKQVTDFLLSERKVEFSGLVAVQYPRLGCWSLALSTGGPVEGIQRTSPEELVTLFVPSSPPLTGYVSQVPRSEVLELNISIDEGLRFLISGGVIKPDAVLPGKPPVEG